MPLPTRERERLDTFLGFGCPKFLNLGGDTCPPHAYTHVFVLKPFLFSDFILLLPYLKLSSLSQTLSFSLDLQAQTHTHDNIKHNQGQR